MFRLLFESLQIVPHGCGIFYVPALKERGLQSSESLRGWPVEAAVPAILSPFRYLFVELDNTLQFSGGGREAFEGTGFFARRMRIET
jgi:hypothetical protein